MSEPDFWNHMTHEEIFAAVHSGPGPGISVEAEDMWRQAREIIIAAETTMHSAVVDSQQGWESAGADAARSGLSSLNAWALGAADDAYSTLLAIDGQAGSAATVRRNVAPPYGEVLFAAQTDALLNPNSRSAADRLVQAEANAATTEVQERGENARAALEEYVRQSYTTLQTMDYWSVPPLVTVDTSPVSPAGTTSGGGTGGPGSAGFGPVGGIGGSGVGGTAGGAGLTPVANVPVGLGGATGGVVGGGVVGGAPAGSPTGVVPAVPVGRRVGPVASVPGAGPAGSRASGSGGGGVGSERAGTGGAPVALAPGAGGRGARPGPGGRPGTPGGNIVRPVIPRAPSAVAPSPTWRDLVAGGPAARPVAGPTGGIGGGPGGGSGGSGGVGPATPRTPWGDAGPRLSPVGSTMVETGRGPSTGSAHGLYPPMAGGGSGGQGQERRRAPFLIDDSGVFDVDVPYTDPVIGGELPTGQPREA